MHTDFSMNNIPWVCITYHHAGMYFIPNYVYVLHISEAFKGSIPMQDDIKGMLSIPLKQ